MNPSAYAGEPMLPNGIQGLVMSVALMSYTCNGFQYVVNMGKSAENPTRNIPLAFCLSALVGAAIYGLIGFAATHAFSFGEIGGKNLGGIAEMMMPNALYLFFLIGGAIFALATSMVGGIISGYRPLMACARDGWLPAILARRTKCGNVPYVQAVLYVMSMVPILVGLDLGAVATICLFPGAFRKMFVNIYAMTVPQRFETAWKNSGMNISIGMYRFLLVIGSVAALLLCVFYFISNKDLQILMILVALGIAVYSFLCCKFGNIQAAVKKEYSEG